MSDISKMLRDRADAHNGDRLCDEAADLIDRLTAERDALREQLDWTVRENDRLLDEGRDSAAELASLRADAERWRHARRILTVEDIEYSQDMFDTFGVEGDERWNLKADAAIDAARAKEPQA